MNDVWINGPPILEPEPSDVWTSWHPQVGDRVRVRLSKECPAHWDRHPKEILLQVDGTTAVVVGTNSTRIIGHPIMARLEQPFHWDNAWWSLAYLAVAELAPLPEVGAAREKGES